MRKLSRNEIKKLSGGMTPPDDGSGGCPAGCTGTRDNNYQGGSCSPVTIPGSNSLPSTSSCECSVSGGHGCVS